MLTPTTQAQYREPITRAFAKTKLEITGTGDDSLIDDLIAEARSEIEEVLGRSMARATWNEVLAGKGRTELDLSAFPIDGTEVANLTVKEFGTTLTVAADDYFVLSEEEGILWRSTGWPSGTVERDSDGTPRVEVDYIGGWVMPGAIGDWTAATAYSVGQWVRPTDLSQSVYLMECTTAGTSHANTEPTWSSLAAGGTVTDGGTLVWTARRAWELPKLIRQVAFLAVQRGYARERPDLVRRQAEGFSETYARGEAEGSAGILLSARAIAAVQRFAR